MGACMNNILYLGSQSSSRHKLLQDAQVPFVVLGHTSDEVVNVHGLSFHEHVLAVARGKMKTLMLPDPTTVTSEYIFVLTADTLIRLSQTGTILGKPKDRVHAREMLEAESLEPLEIVTGCCLDKLQNVNGTWVVREQKHWVTAATAEFAVPSNEIETYLDKQPIALLCCGAGMVEGFGAQYLKSINGSYSSVIGLPLFELQSALKSLGF